MPGRDALSNGGQRSPSPPPVTATPSLVATLPTVSSLEALLSTIQSPNADAASRVEWIRDVLFLVNRTSASSGSTSAGTDLATGPAQIDDPALQRLAGTAIELLLVLIPVLPSSGTKLGPAVAESLYLRATLSVSGAFPEHIAPNPRSAFRAFEAAARAGHHAAWFRLGRDYEAFGDAPHARECFERGARHGDAGCVYRLGMAHLLGQLGLPAGPASAVPLLHRAASLASVLVPQPAYVYALLLLDDFAHAGASVPAALLAPLLPPGTESPEHEARRLLERAAFLHFAPAQYKLGHAYEFAVAPFPFDPLLSVQYYSLASQQGEPEADMALSKWFLCGAEEGEGSIGGGFAKDEALAFAFAERGARAGLPSAQFAMGYYWEVGVGTPQDVQNALKWYEKAAAQGNADARDRLSVLAQPTGSALSRGEHDTLTERTLVRKRTLARQRSDAYSRAHPKREQRARSPRPDAARVVDVVRRNSRFRAGQRGRVGHPRQVSAPVPAPAPAQAKRQSYPYQQQQQQQVHAATLPPPSSPGTPRTRFPERARYSLVDVGPAAPPRGASPGPPRPASGAQTREQTPPPRPASSGGGVRYNTFAEMGIQGSKLEEKECVIM
ncbi:HCP-like protein [Phellopilus nigrolimitatus]|nr:HCP-like protein [Phellopilus nigrolimitatus]